MRGAASASARRATTRRPRACAGAAPRPLLPRKRAAAATSGGGFTRGFAVAALRGAARQLPRQQRVLAADAYARRICRLHLVC
jgi:hypothetical protein